MATTMKVGMFLWLIFETACSKLLYLVESSCLTFMLFLMVSAIPPPFFIFLFLGSVWKPFLFSSDPSNHCWSSSLSLSHVSAVTNRSIWYSFKVSRMMSSLGLIDLVLTVANQSFFYAV